MSPQPRKLPRVRWDGFEVIVEKGTLTDDDLADIDQIFAGASGEPSGPYVVVATELDVQLLRQGEPVPAAGSAVIDLVDLVEGAMSPVGQEPPKAIQESPRVAESGAGPAGCA